MTKVFGGGATPGIECALPPFAFAAGATRLRLRVLATSDLHAHLAAYDYFTDRPAPHLGLAQIAPLVAAARAEPGVATLLVDNGDFLQGTPLGDLAAEGALGPGPHPVIAAMNALGYDAAALGNHEFNFGLPVLRRVLAAARFPVLAANISGAGLPCAPRVVLTRQVADGAGRVHALRIGLAGFVPPQILTWDRQHLEGRLAARDILAAARDLLPALRRDSDLVVALAHTGLGGDAHRDGHEDAGAALAGLPGIDAVVMGHSHQVFPGPAFDGRPGVAEGGLLQGKPAVMPGFGGSHLGVIDLALEPEGAGWRVADALARAVPVTARAEDDSPLAALVAPAHAATLAQVRRPIGHAAAPLNSFFAQIAPDPALRLVAEAQRDRILRSLQETGGCDAPILSAVSPFKTGARLGPGFYTDIPAGPLLMRHVADLYYFPNTLCALRVTGAGLVDWLEQVAAQFATLAEGAAAPLLAPDFPGYNFDTLFGLSYAFDLTAPPGQRLRDLCHAGRPVRPGDRFVVATNSYRAAGGGLSVKGERVLGLPEQVRDILLRHIAAGGTPPEGPDGWRFAPMPGRSALFDTAPAAQAHLHRIASLAPEPLGLTEAGFLRLRLTF